MCMLSMKVCTTQRYPLFDQSISWCFSYLQFIHLPYIIPYILIRKHLRVFLAVTTQRYPIHWYGTQVNEFASTFTMNSGLYLSPSLFSAVSCSMLHVIRPGGVACPLPTSNKQTDINHVPHTPRCPFNVQPFYSCSCSCGCCCLLLPVAVCDFVLRSYRPPLLCLSASRCSSKAVYYAALYFCLRN